MKLFRQTFGEGDPLIVIHGLLGASGNWQTLAKNHFGLLFKTVTIDLRNHGKSPHAESGTYAEMSEDLLELMDDEGIGRAHILGHSMGGKLAMHFALHFPERVDKLIIADIAPRGYPRSHDYIFEAFHSVDLNRVDSRSEVEEVMARNIKNAGVLQFLLKNLTRRGQEFMWGMNLAAIERNYEKLLGEIEGQESFDGDTLFIRGGKSNYVLDSDLPSIKALFPYSSLETIPQAGHWLHAEAPDEFSDVCLKFLR